VLFRDWLPPTYDPSAVRHGGNECSAEAHAKIISRKKGMQASILELAKSRGGLGLTCKEVAAHFETHPSNVSGRLSELKLLGELVHVTDAVGRFVKRDGSAVLVAATEGGQ